MNEEELRQFSRSVDLIEKLTNETARLRRDVQLLVNRIEPFQDESKIDVDNYFNKPKNFRDVIELIQSTRQVLLSCELAVGKATARIDQIVSDGWSREDLKPYLRSTSRKSDE